MESTWINLIGGAWRHGQPDERCMLVDPATEQALGALPTPSKVEIEEAITAAHAAFQSWRLSSPLQRSDLLRKTAQSLLGRAEIIARLLVVETGKPRKQALGEIEAAAQYLIWFAEEGRRLEGSVYPSRNPREMALMRYEPVGVVAAYPAWNFPVALACRKLGPAIAAGCSVILKPSPEGTGAVVELIRCFVDAGAPAGLVTLLVGDPETINRPLMDDPRVRKLSFTGSTTVGKKLLADAARTLKRTSMELGGHAAVIVLDDVDARAVGELSARRKFANAGQICVSPGRFLVHKSSMDRFVDGFLESARGLRLGSGHDPGTEMGPVINKRRFDAVLSMIERSRNSANLLLGGRRSPRFETGYFVEPTVFGEAAQESAVMTEEVFGPVAAINSFDDLDSALQQANATEYGLANFVFTNDLSKAHAVNAALESGMVGINTFMVGMPEAPYGGTKQSGYGVEGGRLGILDYVYPKLSVYSF